MGTITIKESSLRNQLLHSHEQRISICSGLITGQIAGLIMAASVMLVFLVFYGKGLFYPVQVIGSAVFGESSIQNLRFLPVLTGLLLHQLGPSLIWGFIFGLVTMKVEMKSTIQALSWGLGLGIISMIGPYEIVPILYNAMNNVDIWNREIPMVWDWIAHLIFGASFVLFPYIDKKLQKRFPLDVSRLPS